MGGEIVKGPGTVIYQQEPSKRPITMETDAWLPAMQAVLVASAWALVAGLVVLALIVVVGCPWWAMPLVMLGLFAVIFATQLTATIRERRDLLWKREELERRDLDGDGMVGKPERTTLTVELVTRHQGGLQWQIIDFGVAPEKATALAKGIIAGQSFSEGAWTGNGALFSKAEFRALRGELLERGLLEWRNGSAPAQGVVLTAPGRAVFEKLTRM